MDDPAHTELPRRGVIPAERIVTIGDFVDRVYLPWIKQHKRPSTQKAYMVIACRQLPQSP